MSDFHNLNAGELDEDVHCSRSDCNNIALRGTPLRELGEAGWSLWPPICPDHMDAATPAMARLNETLFYVMACMKALDETGQVDATLIERSISRLQEVRDLLSADPRDA